MLYFEDCIVVNFYTQYGDLKNKTILAGAIFRFECMILSVRNGG